MSTIVLAAIPYRTLPDFPLGPITIRTFGLMVALGIVLGTVVGSRYVANRGIDPEQFTSLATRAVIAGLVGARVTWVLSHLDQIEAPIDVIAVWDGGMQFSGGLLFGAIVGWWSARGRYSRTQRWHILDGTAVGLTLGLAVGRLGCIAVGEHFGGPTDFFLGMTYLGGGTIEPVAVNETIHNTAFYELLHLAVLGAIFAVLLRQASDRQRPWPLGMLGTIFLIWYGTARFLTDSLRVNDERLWGLTGAQWACFGVVALGLWLLVTMGGRRASQDGRAVVPVTAEPQSAVKVVPGSTSHAAAGGDATGQAPTDEPAGAAGRGTADAHRSGLDASTSADVGPETAGRATTPDAATATGEASDDVDRDTPSWADRADVRDGSAGFVAGVRVVEGPDVAGSDDAPLAPEVDADDDRRVDGDAKTADDPIAADANDEDGSDEDGSDEDGSRR